MMYLLVPFLTLLSLKEFILLNITVKKYELENAFGDAVSSIAKTVYIKNQKHVSISYSIEYRNIDMFSDILSGVTKKLEKRMTLQIESVKSVKPTIQRRFSNIIFIDSTESLKVLHNKLGYENFKMRKLFSVVAIKKLKIDEMIHIFNFFFVRLILNVNILVLMEENEKYFTLYTYFPFSNNLCNNTFPHEINKFYTGTKLWENNKFIYQKSRNLERCPLKIGTAVLANEPAIIFKNLSLNGVLELYGIEKDIFQELSLRLNFTPNFKAHFQPIGQVFENGNGSGVLQNVLTNDEDVAIGFSSLQYIRTIFLSETKFYAMHDLVLVGKLFFGAKSFFFSIYIFWSF